MGNLVGDIIGFAVGGPAAVFITDSRLRRATINAAIAFVISGFNPVAAAAAFAGTLYMEHKARQAAKKQHELEEQSKFRWVTIREAAADRQIVFGECRVGGVITFMYLSTDKQYLHAVITLAGHVCQDISEIFFDNIIIPINTAGAVTGTYANYARIRKSLGADTGGSPVSSPAQPFPELVTDSAGQWSDSHRQTGCTKLYVRLKFSTSIFTSGFPNISAVVKGLKVIDPRPSPAELKWTHNPALLAAAVLNDANFGLGAAYGSEIDEPALIDAANTCEERMPVATSAVFTADAATDLLTLAAGLAYPVTGAQVRATNAGGALPVGLAEHTIYFWIVVSAANRTGRLATTSALAKAGTFINFTTAGTGVHTLLSAGTFTASAATDELTLADGQRVPLTGQGVQVIAGDAVPVSPSIAVLPAPLAQATTYYWIRTQNRAGRLATSYANALAGVYIDLTTAGLGTLSITVYDEPRYMANGSFKFSNTPQGILESLMASMAGSAVPTGATWWINAGKYYPPTIDLDASDLAGPITVQSGVSRRESANGVKGIFINPDGNWQQSDFQPLASATYYAQDSNERIWRDMDLTAFVISPSQAQRLAKIELLRTRQGLSVVAPFKPSAYGVVPGRTATLTLPKYGWAAKPFEVMNCKLAFGKDGTIQVGYSFRETAPAIYDWSTSEEQSHDIAQNTDLPSPFPDDITNLVLASGTAQLFIAGDGTVHSRILATWDAVTDDRVITGGHIELEFKKSIDATWQHAPVIRGDDTQAYVNNVLDGVAYDVRVRTVTLDQTTANWTTVLAHTVIGKTAVPSDVTGFSAVQQAQVVLFSCNRVTDSDLDSIEIRLADPGGTWADASPLCNILRGETATTAGVPPGTWDLLCKAKDTSGNYSTNAATVSLTVTSEGNTILNQVEQSPGWLGAAYHLVRHWTGSLSPQSQSLAKDLGWEVFDQYVPNAYTDWYYSSPEIDTGANGFGRIYANIVSVLGPGETLGVANPEFDVDTRLSAGSYDGFEKWTIGTATFRYATGKVAWATGVGNIVISGFQITIDATARNEFHPSIVIGAGGRTFVFDNTYRIAPTVQLTPVGATPLIPGIQNTTLVQSDLHLYDNTNADVGGTANVTITGV